jgi:hypothetical protein
MCRTYGALDYFLRYYPPLRPSPARRDPGCALGYVLPRLQRCNTPRNSTEIPVQIGRSERRVAVGLRNPSSCARTTGLSYGTKRRQARKNVAQPVRAGNYGEGRSKRRRCDTLFMLLNLDGLSVAHSTSGWWVDLLYGGRTPPDFREGCGFISARSESVGGGNRADHQETRTLELHKSAAPKIRDPFRVESSGQWIRKT